MLERLRTKFGKLTQEQASYKVYSIETQYPASRRIFIPIRPIKKLSPGMEPDQKAVQGPGNNKEDNLERSLRRTKRVIRDLALCNRFELFATFTFKADRYDIPKCKSKMANWFKNQQKRNGKFQYLVVAEYHKDGALHFHALIKGYKGKLKPAINSNTGKRIKGRYNLPGYTHGFTDVTKIKQTSEDLGKAANYLCKYITKDMPVMFGKNRYWASKQLERPIIIENPQKWYEGKTPDWMHISKHGVTMVFHGAPHAE